jgi:prepilin-type N-terminal cleavage/methylation domain-containing protein
MKVYSGTNRARKGAKLGFTLIEMIGVLAVIAILAAVLIPKVFEAINNARINNTAMTCNSIKTGCIDHYAKFGSFPVDGSSGTPVAIAAPLSPLMFDQVLLKEQLIDKPFQVKIGDGLAESVTTTRVEIIAAPTAAQQAAPTPVTGVGPFYNLEGSATPNDDINGTWFVEAVITGVTAADAAALNRTIDGSSVSMGAGGQGTAGADLAGRVMYAAPNAGGTTTVYIYLTHR